MHSRISTHGHPISPHFEWLLAAPRLATSHAVDFVLSSAASRVTAIAVAVWLLTYPPSLPLFLYSALYPAITFVYYGMFVTFVRAPGVRSRKANSKNQDEKWCSKMVYRTKNADLSIFMMFSCQARCASGCDMRMRGSCMCMCLRVYSCTVGWSEHLFCLDSKPSCIIGLVENVRHATNVHQAFEVNHRGSDANGAHVSR